MVIFTIFQNFGLILTKWFASGQISIAFNGQVLNKTNTRGHLVTLTE